MRQGTMPRPLPDPAKNNRNLRLYADAIRDVARKRGLPFVDLFDLIGDGAREKPPAPLTDNGIHLSAWGYWRSAPALERGLGLPDLPWHVEIDAQAHRPVVRGARVDEVQTRPDATLRFRVTDDVLPAPPPPREGAPRNAPWQGERVLRMMRSFDAEKIEEVFSDGLLNVLAAPEFAQSDKIRRVFSALENRSYLGDLVGSVSGAGRVQVFIGEENRPVEMHEVSLVLASYGRPGRAMGVVGVLGPTRMAYRHAIGTVSFVSGLLDELVDHLYA